MAQAVFALVPNCEPTHIYQGEYHDAAWGKRRVHTMEKIQSTWLEKMGMPVAPPRGCEDLQQRAAAAWASEDGDDAATLLSCEVELIGDTKPPPGPQLWNRGEGFCSWGPVIHAGACDSRRLTHAAPAFMRRLRTHTKTAISSALLLARVAAPANCRARQPCLQARGAPPVSGAWCCLWLPK